MDWLAWKKRQLVGAWGEEEEVKEGVVRNDSVAVQ